MRHTSPRRALALLACAAALVLVLAGTARAAPARAGLPRAHAAATCNQTWIDATIRNDTPQRMDVQYFSYGFTNAVCDNQGPHSVPARSTDRWKVGDNIFSTVANVVNRLSDGEQLALHATAEKGPSNTISCEWTVVPAGQRPYDCAAHYVRGAPAGQADITLDVYPAPKVSATPPTPVVPAGAVPVPRTRPARCPVRSWLPGTTVNDSGERIALIGMTDRSWWCRAPRFELGPGEHLDRWDAAGPGRDLSLRLDYRLPKHDVVEFAASNRGTAGCAPIDPAHHGPRIYGCEAKVTETRGRQEPSITFRIFRITDGAARPAR